jgi:hypothetical protein
MKSANGRIRRGEHRRLRRVIPPSGFKSLPSVYPHQTSNLGHQTSRFLHTLGFNLLPPSGIFRASNRKKWPLECPNEQAREIQVADQGLDAGVGGSVSKILASVLVGLGLK